MTLGTRLVGVPLAVALAVVAPLIIVRPTPEPVTVKGTSEPKTATAKWRISGEIGGPRAAFLAVRAAGDPPTKSVLVDETGTHRAILYRAKDLANCPTPPRSTGFGDKLWCLVTGHVDAGHELTGTVDGQQTKLTLTLDRKNAFFDREDPPWLGWPFWWLAFGLVAAVLVAIWPARLKSLVQNVQLKKLLKNNKDARPDRKITSLSDWVAEQLLNNADLATVWAAAARVISQGPSKARAARVELGTELNRPENHFPTDFPYLKAAWVEEARTDHKVDDFLTKDGKQRDAHPAAEFEAGVKKIAVYLQDLTKLEQKVNGDLVEACRTRCRERIAQARKMLDFVESTDQLKKLDDELWESEAAYAAAYSREECRLKSEEAIHELTFGSIGISAAQLELTDTGLTGNRVWAWFLTIVSIAIALVFAGVTVYEAAYAPNNIFAGRADYFKLFSAALASGVAATIVAFLGNWRPPKSAAAASS